MSTDSFSLLRDLPNLPGRPVGAASVDWFRQQIHALLGGTPLRPIRDILEPNRVHLKSPQSVRFPLGKLYMFLYDAKGKYDLPYWDRFPLVFIIKFTPDGFIGINLHYLPPRMRAYLFQQLQTLKIGDIPERARLKVTYDIIQSVSRYRFALPAIKRYITSHIRSRMFEIPDTDWEVAIHLPTEMFQKTTRTKVWGETRRKIQ